MSGEKQSIVIGTASGKAEPKPETLEKNQWRIARITDLHRNLDGVPTTATVLLPSKAVLTRTLRQIALLEPAYLELGNPAVPVVEEAPELPLPCLLYTSPSPRDLSTSRMPSSA